ncbi:MAG TPA: hypothetical protein DD670_00965 [Planctomycetaceae bacterium]|nr:hypothetical protein [Planctomycetaceae bacterium]
MRGIWISAFLLVAFALCAATAMAQSVPIENVVMHLPFNETTGRVFADAGLNGNDGSFCRRRVVSSGYDPIDASAVTATGQFGSGFDMSSEINGISYDTMITVPMSAALPSQGSNFAVSFWMKQENWARPTNPTDYLNPYGVIASHLGNDLAWSVGIDYVNSPDKATNMLVFRTDDGLNIDWSTEVASFFPDSYHHFLCQFEGWTGITALYVDGMSVADTGTSGWLFSTTEGFVIGARDRPDVYYPITTGVLDDFAIINGVVSPSQVASIYGSGVASAGLSLKAHYTMDQTTGSLVADASGSGNDGTLRGYSVYHPFDVADASVDGPIGKAVAFEGALQEFVRIEPSDSQISAGEAFTVTFWANVSNWKANGIIASQNKDSDFGYSIGLHTSGGLIVRTTDYGVSEVKYGGVKLDGTGGLAALPPDEFAHFAVVIDSAGQVAKIFVNGDEVVQDLLNGWTVTEDFGTVLGARRLNPPHEADYVSYPLNGVLDDFAVILGQLTESEVELAMAQGVAALYSVLQIPGDATGDQIVDDADAKRLASNWGVGSATREMGDFNGDGIVGAADAAILAANWGYGVVAETTAVPEPGAMVLVVGAMFVVLLGRRRHG